VQVDVSRIHSLLWTKDVDRAWRWLVAAGLRADTSFGPTGAATGWLFGSGMPFHPLDGRGLSFPIWEVPSLAPPSGALDGAALSSWLRGNADGGHGPVALAVSAAIPSTINEGEASELDPLASRARAANHAVLSVDQFLDFWELREQTQLHWSYSHGLLRVLIQAPEGARAAGLAMALPTHWRNLTLSSWDASWPGAESRRAAGFERESRLISLPDGGGEVVADYR
jgi:hypothetical protein